VLLYRIARNHRTFGHAPTMKEGGGAASRGASGACPESGRSTRWAGSPPGEGWSHWSKLRDESGVTTAVIALMLPLFLGMGALVIDLGMAWQVRRQLQNCADAAALAAAVDLGDQAAASASALAYSFSAGPSGCLNAADPIPAITFIDRNGDALADAIEVIPQHSVQFGLGRMLGTTFSVVRARAVAGKISPYMLFGTEPFGLQVDPDQPCGQAGITQYTLGSQPLQFGVSYTIKYTVPSGPNDAENRAPGNFQALALGGPGNNIYRDNVTEGYQGWVQSCGWAAVQTGQVVSGTVQGLDRRLLNDSSLDTWENCILAPQPVGFRAWSDCPRVIAIAIIDPLAPGNSQPAHILTFGWFFVDSYARQGQQVALITGRFIDAADRHAPPGEWRGDTPWDPDSDLPFGVKLLE